MAEKSQGSRTKGNSKGVLLRIRGQSQNELCPSGRVFSAVEGCYIYICFVLTSSSHLVPLHAQMFSVSQLREVFYFVNQFNWSVQITKYVLYWNDCNRKNFRGKCSLHSKKPNHRSWQQSLNRELQPLPIQILRRHIRKHFLAFFQKFGWVEWNLRRLPNASFTDDSESFRNINRVSNYT